MRYALTQKFSLEQWSRKERAGSMPGETLIMSENMLARPEEILNSSPLPKDSEDWRLE